MRKAFTIVALIAAMFVAGNVQAQSTIYAGYAPESFISGNTSSNYQGFFAGFTKNFGLTKGIGIAAGAEFRMNTKSGDAFFGFGTGKYAVFGADVKFSQFNLFGGYRLGLLDLNSSNNITMKANGFFVGLGYTL